MPILLAIAVCLILLCGQAWEAVEIERVVSGGFCRAWKYYDSSGNVVRIDIFHDASSVGSGLDYETYSDVTFGHPSGPMNGDDIIISGRKYKVFYTRNEYNVGRIIFEAFGIQFPEYYTAP
jgi:hypothetical protein